MFRTFLASLRRFAVKRGWLIAYLVVFCLGWLAFLLQTPAPPGSVEAAYRALQLFGGEFTAEPAWHDEGIGPFLQIMRFAAPLLLITSVVDALSNVVALWLRRTRQMFSADQRVVLLGFGAVNHALARHLIGQGKFVTAVDRQIDAADQALAADIGILTIEGDLAEKRTLARARLSRAADIYVACGSDDVNIEIGALSAQVVAKDTDAAHGAGTIAEKRRLPPARIHAHLSSTRLTADLGNARDLGFQRGRGFEAFSVKTGAARDLLVAARLTERARDFGQSRVHVVLCGMGDHGEALMIETLLTAFADDLGPPAITVMDIDAEFAEARWNATYTRLHSGPADPSLMPPDTRPHITFLTRDLRTLDMEGDAFLNAVDASDMPATAYVFSCGADLVNISAALRMESAMQRLQRRAAPIYARQWDQVVGPGDLGDDDPLTLVRTFGNANQTAARILTDTPQQAHLGQKLHATYQLGAAPTAAMYPSQDQMRADWASLPAHARRSNIRAVRQASTKLIAFGLQWRGMDKGALPHITPEMQTDILSRIDGFDWGATPHDPIQRRIMASARTEHARWITDRAIEGFRQAPTPDGTLNSAVRDNDRCWHNLMKPFDALTAKEKDNDLTLLRLLALHCGDIDGPTAYWTSTATLSLGGDLAPEAVTQATELEVCIPAASVAIAQAQFDALSRDMTAWARSPQACRLHMRVAMPMPQMALTATRTTPLRDPLNAVLRDIAATGLLVDVTRTAPRGYST
ncbi:MAG: NAD-binding protein [Pseudomonadota bacterium]